MSDANTKLDNRRIALFLDGTWNTLWDNTNVWRLKSLCVNDENQVVYYSKGVGTDLKDKVLGGALGYGIDQEVIDAYEWLIENYRAEDEIFIFGFSRGAYTARSLSGLISKCGLLKPGAALSVRELYKRYRLANAPKTIERINTSIKNNKTDDFTQQDWWMSRYCYAPAVWFLGVWDTVGALGISFGDVPQISSESYQFLETDLRQSNTRAFHALAIDEHRSAFAPTLWIHPNASERAPRPIDQVEQRWFVGAHANVGGGYVDDLLAQRPLQWILGKAQQHHLKFRDQVAIDGDLYNANITDSYAEFGDGIYQHLLTSRRFYRAINGIPLCESGDGPGVTINETIDRSVFERVRERSDYRPQNLLDWEAKYNTRLATLTNSVMANDPKQLAPDEVPLI